MVMSFAHDGTTVTEGRIIVRGSPTAQKWRTTVERLKEKFPEFDK